MDRLHASKQRTCTEPSWLHPRSTELTQKMKLYDVYGEEHGFEPEALFLPKLSSWFLLNTKTIALQIQIKLILEKVC